MKTLPNALEQLISEFITLNGMECEETLDLLADLDLMDGNELKNGVLLATANYKDTLLNSGRCPECGTKLEFERDYSQDNYVPYGDTQVLESAGFTAKCGNCGYEN